MAVQQSAHPNEFDRKRIERTLKTRQRYRYVTPRVAETEGGYRIESPCCSRNIDRSGGVIDVALLLHDAEQARWQLFRKDHASRVWVLDGDYDLLVQLLTRLSADPERIFWQ
jgi:hypothetical protein